MNTVFGMPPISMVMMPGVEDRTSKGRVVRDSSILRNASGKRLAGDRVTFVPLCAYARRHVLITAVVCNSWTTYCLYRRFAHCSDLSVELFIVFNRYIIRPRSVDADRGSSLPVAVEPCRPMLDWVPGLPTYCPLWR